MSEFKIIDKKGVWVKNNSEFGLPDYPRQSENPGTELIVLQPGVPTKIELSDFLKAQETLELLTVDPTTGEEIGVAPVPVDIKKK